MEKHLARNRTIVRVIISSKAVNCEDMEKILNLEPTKKWAIGDFRGKSSLKHDSHSLVYELEELDYGKEDLKCIHVPEIVDNLLDKFMPITEKIQSIKDVEVAVSCILYFKDVPCLTFDKFILDKIQALNAIGLDIDMYLN